MSDETDKTCPLCAEEMDLTDRLLKPCKCGYDICVWCWHHIMDMAEKDGAEGRCPACRTPYDKEKIVGEASKRERLANEIGSEKKVRPQKPKAKSAESRIHLGNMQVIQRNLVYVVGLPLNLADEDLLQQKEYFNKYGKVLKVSMSRTSAGVVQQFPNSTCSVYITYAKEEEAIRCIQSVHGFVLDGRPLRACFGTTKYCHIWLRNMTCNNPDCLYLHEIGAEEDSFSKDEVVSAYTSRVNQITGAGVTWHYCSGSVLPPPIDEHSMQMQSSTRKPNVKVLSNIGTGEFESSPPKSSSGRPGSLPPGAAWGMRALNYEQHASNVISSNKLSKQALDPWDDSDELSTAFSNDSINSSLVHPVSEKNSKTGELSGDNPMLSVQGLPPSRQNSASAGITPRGTTSNGCIEHVPGFIPEKNVSDSEVEDLRHEMSSVSISIKPISEPVEAVRSNCPALDQISHPAPEIHDLPPHYDDQSRLELSIGKESCNEVSELQLEWASKLPSARESISSPELDEDVKSFNSQRLEDSEIATPLFSNLSDSLYYPSQQREKQHRAEDCGPISIQNSPSFVNRNGGGGSYFSSPYSPVSANGFSGKLVGELTGLDRAAVNSNWLPYIKDGAQVDRIECYSDELNSSTLREIGENSLISDRLSMDINVDGTSARLFGNMDKQYGSLRPSDVPSNQSRFSFARYEEPRTPMEPLSLDISQVLRNSVLKNDFVGSKDLFPDKLGSSNSFISSRSDGLRDSCGIQALFSSSPSASKVPPSAPPGFCLPTRPPPPGFTTNERLDSHFNAHYGTKSNWYDTPHTINSYQPSSNGNVNAHAEMEFMDPAILAVGRSRHSSGFTNSSLGLQTNFSSQSNTAENDAKLQLLMQRSLPSQQRHMYSDIRNDCSHYSDTYKLYPPRREQAQPENYIPYGQPQPYDQHLRNPSLSNGLWDIWNNNMEDSYRGVSGHIKTEMLGFNGSQSGFGDSKLKNGWYG